MKMESRTEEIGRPSFLYWFMKSQCKCPRAHNSLSESNLHACLALGNPMFLRHVVLEAPEMTSKSGVGVSRGSGVAQRLPKEIPGAPEAQNETKVISEGTDIESKTHMIERPRVLD